MPNPDDLDQSAEEDDASEPSPVTPEAPDLEAIVRAALEKSLPDVLNSRISGLQSSLDRRFQTLAKELRNAGLTPEDQQQVLEEESNRENQRAFQLAELIKRRKTFPEAVDFMIESMEREGLDDQLVFIQSMLKPVKEAALSHAPSSSDVAPTDAPVPDVDKNNPASRRSPSLESGDEMNDELADQILGTVGKGDWRRVFGRGG